MAPFASSVSVSSSASGGAAALVDGQTDFSEDSTWIVNNALNQYAEFDFGVNVEFIGARLFNPNGKLTSVKRSDLT